jgi:hypothetical protein
MNKNENTSNSIEVPSEICPIDRRHEVSPLTLNDSLQTIANI